MKKQKAAKKIIIGLTGSFGSGKTTVARIFKDYGALVIDADKISRRLIKPRTQIHHKIISAFGSAILAGDGNIDRRKLAKVVFNDSKSLKILNNIMHPEIIRVIKSKIRSAAGVVVLDAPLLIEVGLLGLADKLIVVKAGRDAQFKRLVKKTGLSNHEITKRIKAQLPLRKKIALADFVIDNSGTISRTREQAQVLRRRLWKS